MERTCPSCGRFLDLCLCARRGFRPDLRAGLHPAAYFGLKCETCGRREEYCSCS